MKLFVFLISYSAAIIILSWHQFDLSLVVTLKIVTPWKKWLTISKRTTENDQEESLINQPFMLNLQQM